MNPPPKCVFSSGFRVVSSFVVDCFYFPSQQTQPKNQIRTSSCKAVRCALLSVSGPVFPFLVLLAAFLRSRCHLTAQYTVSLVSVTSPLSYSLDFSALLNPGRCQCSLWVSEPFIFCKSRFPAWAVPCRGVWFRKLVFAWLDHCNKVSEACIILRRWWSIAVCLFVLRQCLTVCVSMAAL